MTRYQLAKLVALAGGTLKSRKRLQKLVYLLQASGCPLNASFRLHHYGPYSQELAGLIDELVQLKVLEEMGPDEGRSGEYSYRLSDVGHGHLASFENSDRGREETARMNDWEAKLERFLREDLRTLELASTVAYFHSDQSQGWQSALELMSRFKNVPADSEEAVKALTLAQELEG